MTRLLAVMTLAMLAASVQAQDTLTGKFQGTTPNGAKLTLDLTATDTALSGTLTRDDEAVKITDGKVQGKTFTFKATVGGKDEAFSGELAGNDIKVWLDRRGPEGAVTLSRVKT